MAAEQVGETRAPELKPYFTSAAHDDYIGVMQTLTWTDKPAMRPARHMFITTPTVIATVDAIVAAVPRLRAMPPRFPTPES